MRSLRNGWGVLRVSLGLTCWVMFLLVRNLKPMWSEAFYAIGHGLLIPLFFLSIGLSSDYRALSGHWGLLAAILVVAVLSKICGCGLAALASEMGLISSLRFGCGMISRGEVGLIVTAMGASSGIFGRSEVAVMVAVVLLTTVLTPIGLRAAFHVKTQEEIEEELREAIRAARESEIHMSTDAETSREGSSIRLTSFSRAAQIDCCFSYGACSSFGCSFTKVYLPVS